MKTASLHFYRHPATGGGPRHLTSTTSVDIMLSALLTTLDESSSLVVDLQTSLTAIPALGPENGGDGEEKKAQWLKEHLETTLKLPVTTYNVPDPRVSCGFRPNLVTRINGQTDQTLWIIGHMDVVPVGDESLWETPPFTVTQKGDELIGRGVEDNQQGIVTSLLVAHALVQHDYTPETGLGIILVADEETGMTHGLPQLLENMPDLIRKDDLILVPDIGSSNGDMVQVAEKSVLWLKITVNGKQCHASTPDEGINSLVVAARCIVAIENLHNQFAATDPLFMPQHSTFVPTKKEANVENINTMPGKDVFYVDCRVLPEYSLDDIQRACQSLVDKIAHEYGITITVEPQNYSPSLTPTPDRAPVIERLCKALKDDRGIVPRLCGSSGQTVATVLRNKGYEAAAWSTLIGNAHQPNERSSIKYTIADARTIMRMLCE